MDYLVNLLSINIAFCADDSKTILDSALDKQYHLGYSCKKGECGSCSAHLLKGLVKDASGSLINEGSILTCCSYPQSDITLDVEYSPELKNIKVKWFN